MKKRFSTILLAVMMLLSFCSFTAYADETALELTHYDIITNNIRLEFSSEVSDVTATLKSTDNNAITVTPTVSSDSKIWDLKLSEKMDITKQYVLNFSADTLTAQKLIKFTVYDNETFDNYTQISDLDSKYKHYSDYNYGGSTISGSGKYELVTEENGNKRLKVYTPTGTGFWNKTMLYNHGKKYYNFEMDFEAIVPENLDPNNNDRYLFGLRHSDYQVPYGTNVYFHSSNDPTKKADQRYIINNSAFFADSQKFSNVDYNYQPNNTYAFSLAQNGDKDVYSIYENGDNLVTMSGTYSSNSFYYILEGVYNWSYYLDNYKLYAYEMTDYVDMKLDYINVTTKGITVAYNDSISGTPTVELLKGDGTIATTVTTSDKTLNIIPAERLDLNKRYMLKVNATNGVSNCDISKLIEFDVIVDDDFDSYTQLSDLDDTYFVRFEATETDISKSEGIELESGKLKMALGTCRGFWVKDLKNDDCNNRKYYNMEADIQYITPDGKNINDGDLYYINVMHTGWYINTSKPTDDVYFHIGYGHEIRNPGSLFTDGSKFANTNYHNKGTGTYAFSLVRNAENTKDVYSIAENGTSLVTATGNVKTNNFYYILAHPHGVGYGTYYLDNYKLYAPILTDATTFPEFATDGDAFITSKYIKINFNDEIDSSAENLAKVKVTSLGSDLDVTKTVSGKTLTISGNLPFNREITYDVNGVKNVNGTTATFTAKSFKLQKLWYETFDNAETIADLYGDYVVPSKNGQTFNYDDNGKYVSSTNLPTATLKEFVETDATKDVFSLVERNGSKMLKMNNTQGYAFTHFESYAGETAGRKIWTDTITEFDFDTDGSNAQGFYFVSPMFYAGTVNNIGAGWQSGGNGKSFTASDSNKFSITAIRNKNNEDKWQTALYVDGNYSETITTNSCAEGEFGFQNNSNNAMYIDNIKVYKVVDFTADEYVWLTNTTVKTETVGETEKTKVSGTINLISYSEDKAISGGNAIVVAYNEDGKILGINTVATESVSAKGQKTFTYTIDCSEKDVERVSVFVWDSLSGMKPVIQNRSTTDITIVK